MTSLQNLMLMMMSSSEAVDPWFHPVRYILLGLIALLSLLMILIVLLQPGNSEGLGALQGSTETFFGKNKAKNMEGKLRKFTVGIAIAIVVLCIVFGALELITL